MIQNGRPDRPGSHWDGEGVNFALFSSAAEAVELCLFDAHGNQQRCYQLPEQTNGSWYGYLPGCAPGQRYGYRVHGPWSPAEGLRHNPSKLLIDPYARELDGVFKWSGAVFDYDLSTLNGCGPLQPNLTDSASSVPKCVVSGASPVHMARGPGIPWSETVIYEANVRGYTMCHPDIPDHERGKFRGLSNGKILEYLKALGITTLELLPVHSFIDEAFLVGRGLKNYWGYNSINYFTPHSGYADQNATREFRDMVDAIHDSGIEVILDVVYNHTCEGGQQGPSLSFRGIDNLAYYRTAPGHPDRYVNDTGCGNTLNVDHPQVQALVLDSLVHWHKAMAVDGFRFDLAPVLGRTAEGFDPQHELLQQISGHPELEMVKLIAEPWDTGPGGYQLGRFPYRWAEWNDRYRDTARKYWHGESNMLSDLAKHLHGSADIFEASGRPPSASINFITSHDGFTLNDLVSYEDRHNKANGEDNKDGHRHNFSCNHGIEGPASNPMINGLRRRQRLNMLATLLLSNGTPMLLAGDEFGNSQEGNNNAYAQDNEIGWLDWSGQGNDPEFLKTVRELIQLRRRLPYTKLHGYLHGNQHGQDGLHEIQWLRPGGGRMQTEHWYSEQAVSMLLRQTCKGETGEHAQQEIRVEAAAIMLNASGESQVFVLKDYIQREPWTTAFYSAGPAVPKAGTSSWELSPRSIACIISSG